MRFASVKTLKEQLDLEPEKAKLLRRIMKRSRTIPSVTPQEVYDKLPAVASWRAQLHNPPSWPQIKLEAANAILGGHGVEVVWGEDGAPLIEYVNMGDPYICTVMRYQGAWRVSPLGDVVEAHQRRYGYDSIR